MQVQHTQSVGIALNNMGPSQATYEACRELNTWVGQNRHGLAFYENLSRPCMVVNFAIMPIFEMHDFGGLAIATSFSTALKLLNSAERKLKVFYAWDLEWMRFPQKRFSDLRRVYGDLSLKLFARSDHARVIEQAFNRPVIASLFSLDRIYEECYQSQDRLA